MSVQAIPTGYENPIPYLVIRDAARAIEFYKELFDATEAVRMSSPDGSAVMHAELKIRNCILMLGEENLQRGMPSPLASAQPPPVSVMLYVPDVDAVFARAVRMGAKALMPVTDMFWGDRFGKFADPFGHHWAVATHKEDLSPEECGRRAAEAMKHGC